MGLKELSGREIEVMRVAATGASTRAIAEQLFIGKRTVDSHLASIYRKMHVTSRVELFAKLATGGGSTQVAPRSNRVSGLASPTAFVGRVDELTAIAKACEVAGAGRRRMVVIGGESGAGKSALLARALDTVVPAGATVLTAQSVEGLGPPFGLITDAIEPFLEAFPGDLEAVVGTAGGVLETLMPGLAHRLPTLPDSVEPSARLRLVIDAFLHVLRFATVDGPLVLVLEDLHWTDVSTVSFLRRLLMNDGSHSIAILASFRDTELDQDGALSGLLADLWRVDDVQRLNLGALSLDDAKRLARELLGHAVSDEFVARVHEATAGNALYLSQLLSRPQSSMGEQRGNDLPESLQQVVSDRLRRAGASEVGPLDVAAVIGLDFDVSVLVQAVGLAELDGRPDVLALLERAARAGLVRPVDGEEQMFRFVHAVVRAALVDRMVPARLARVHSAVGHSLAEIDGEGARSSAVIAGHLARSHRAEDRIEAGRVAVSALSGDLARLAPDEAAMLATQVLELLPKIDAADRVRLDLLRAMTSVQYLRLDHDAHRIAVLEAIVVARRLGGPVDLALAVEPFRIVPRMGTVDTEILAAADEAIAGLEGSDAVALRARLLGYATYQRSIGGFGFGVADQAEEAVADARASGDPAALAMTLYALASVLVGSPDVERQLEVAAEQQSRRLDLPADIDSANGYRVMGTVHLQACNRDEFTVDLELLRNSAEQTQTNFGRSMATMWDSLSHLADGDLERAAAANDALLPQAVADPNVLLGWLAQSCLIRAEQGRVAEVVPLVDQTLAEHGDLAVVTALAAWVHGTAGNYAHAWAVLDPLLASDFSAVPDDWLLTATFGLLSPVLARMGTSEQCRLVRDRLVAYSGQILVVGSGTAVLGAVDRYLGQLSARIGDREHALAEFSTSRAIEKRFRAPLCAGHTAVEHASVLISAGGADNVAAARALLDETAAEADGRGWTWLDQRVAAARACL